MDKFEAVDFKHENSCFPANTQLCDNLVVMSQYGTTNIQRCSDVDTTKLKLQRCSNVAPTLDINFSSKFATINIFIDNVVERFSQVDSITSNL